MIFITVNQIRLKFAFHNTRHNTDFHQKMAKMVCEVYCDAYFVTIQGVYCDAYCDVTIQSFLFD